MTTDQRKGAASEVSGDDSFALSAPQISLPKGGGAIRGIGEKFSANPVTGTGALSVPIALSPGRAGFGPQLALSYDSGAGNGTFGLGWQLALPAITRKTDKGLPRYLDATDSDVFILAGSEDLVPEFRKDAATGEWVKARNSFVYNEDVIAGYRVRCYRPRIEGLFARIERWSSETDPADVFWRSISKDNVTTYYGRDDDSRIADPADKRRIFSWLICESYDDRGNAIRYEYRAEDGVGLDPAVLNERNRSRLSQRYLKRIKYCNKTPRIADEDLAARTDWLFEAVFDYGEHDAANPASIGTGPWALRHDPFSSYRSGFEVRTYRLCRRVLMFHHFPAEDIGRDCLVKSTDFQYRGIAQNKPNVNPGPSFILGVEQAGYRRNGAGGYERKAPPPLQFEYSAAEIQQTVREVDAASLENLPAGLGDESYHWVDLEGCGVSGILSEHADAWFYKRNLSPLFAHRNDNDNGGTAMRNVAAFAPGEWIGAKPAVALSSGWQVQDLDGDGKPDLVNFGGPAPGFFELDEAGRWDTFVPFRALPNVNWRDPNLRFIDLTGDGLADILLTEDHAFTWHRSLGETGFAPAERTMPAFDKEHGPRLVLADGEQSIYLADFSGDGLTDLVRIRNGEVCYWPNLGYGRFGAKIAMDNSPWFDHPEQFSQQRIRLADVDGSGLVDIIYLGRDGAAVYFNQSGNGWSAAAFVGQLPHADNLATVQAVDLFGNGTACLVWSSPLPGYARSPMRYIDLMGGQKPHLLIGIGNNLGAATRIDYAPSTKFYLQDRAAGRPWITRLPFPVHVVEKVTVTDRWRNTAFTTTYSYHHGYFDGHEREFRGFGRVEQVDTESYGAFVTGNRTSPYITNDLQLYQPPVKTVTWFHCGAALDRERILAQFAKEYFPQALAGGQNPLVLDTVFREKPLPEPELSAQDLSADEWREALRACKGMRLRQEVYELDVDALHPAAGKPAQHLPARLFSTAAHNCGIRCLQPRGNNPHAVFLVTESEAVNYHYELDLRATAPLKPDPRVLHTLNLSYDELGNVRQSVAVAYPRWRQFADGGLAQYEPLIREVQRELHVAYTETHHTRDAIDAVTAALPVQYYRLRVPSETQTFELTGFTPDQGAYFDIEEFRDYRLSDILPGQGARAVVSKQYHEVPQDTAATKRLVEHSRTVFFKDDLSGPLELGRLGRRGLLYEQYKLALTEALLDAVFTAGQLNDSAPDGVTARAKLRDPLVSGYVRGGWFFVTPPPDAANEYWMRSGTAGYAPDAAQHFYLAERYTDACGNATTLQYDGNYDLFVQSSSDALGNTVAITQFDYRILAPSEVLNTNGNYTAVAFDTLGMQVASAVMGKQRTQTGDTLAGLQLDLPQAALQAFLAAGYDPTAPRQWLGNATSRFVYDFGATLLPDGTMRYGDRPASACNVVRETYSGAAAATKIQVSLEYSDGSGSVLVKKSQAEPDPDDTAGNAPLRWIASGKTVSNNKGNPVKQYEPHFSDTEHRFDAAEAQRETGVTPVMYYDAASRLVRTESPDGSYSRVEFSPWQAANFDANDTSGEPGNPWYARYTAAPASADDKRAAAAALVHHNTPSLTMLDSLGREAIGIVHNRIEDPTGGYSTGGRNYRDEHYLTFTRMDAEGKPLWVRDARGNRVMQYVWPALPDRDEPRVARDFATNGNPNNDLGGSLPAYDMAGNLLYQHSMEAGDRWMLSDALGGPMFAWDINDQGSGTALQRRRFFTQHDVLRRPVGLWLAVDAGDAALLEAFEYCDANRLNGIANLNEAQQRNLIGQTIRHWDTAGLSGLERVDLCGKPAHITRTLAKPLSGDTGVLDWNIANRSSLLEGELFHQLTEYDALGRMTLLYDWHRDLTFGANGAQQTTPGATNRVTLYAPEYSARGILIAEWLHLRATKTTDANARVSFNKDPQRSRQVIKSIVYDAKGQKLRLELGNDTLTRYTYDPDNFRLTHLYTRRRGAGFTNDCASNTAGDARPQRPCGVQNLHYTYDAAGNVTHIQDDAQHTLYFANAAVEPSNDYTYDALYRLIGATGRENAIAAAPVASEGAWPDTAFPSADALRTYTQRYSYDAVGNFVEVVHVPGTGTGWTRRYATRADNNRLERTWYGNNTQNAVTYRHDAHGNILNLNRTVTPPPLDPAEQWGANLRWDWRDMLRDFDLLGGGVARYRYGIDKQRMRKHLTRAGGAVEDRIYLGGYELYRRYDAQNRVLEEIESHHVFEGEARVLLVDDVIVTDRTHANGTRYQTEPMFRYQYGNLLGSACLELDHQAQIVSYEEYHPHGTSAYRAMRRDTEAPPKRYRFAGMERDEESGLGYHSARYYMPWTGRWLSADPIGIDGGLNVFVYANNQPISWTDSSGRQPERGRTPAEMIAAVQALHRNRLQEESGVVQQFKEEGYEPSQKVTQSQIKNVPSLGLNSFVSNLDRQLAAERQKAEMQLRAAAVVAAVGVTLIAPEVVALLELEGMAATGVLAVGDLLSSVFKQYGTTGRVEVSDTLTDVVMSRALSPARSNNTMGQSIVDDAAKQRSWLESVDEVKRLRANVFLGTPASERRGLEAAIEQMAWQDWKMSPVQFKRPGNQGIDLFFEGRGANTGLYGFLEAKPGSGLSRLKNFEGTLTKGMYGKVRQSSWVYLEINLESYIAQGGVDADVAREMIWKIRAQQINGQKAVLSFVSGSGRKGGSPRLYEVDFKSNVNFKTKAGKAAVKRLH